MKYRGVTFESTPTEKFPDMVTVVKTIKKFSELMNKKFISEHKIMSTIDGILSDILIEKTKKKTERDLVQINGADVEVI